MTANHRQLSRPVLRAVPGWMLGLALVLLLSPPTTAAQTLRATVTHVVDGNTVWARNARGTTLRIRLVGIEAPEVGHAIPEGGTAPGQPWGEEARSALAELVLTQPVRIRVYGRDLDRHILGVLDHGGQNVNLWLVRSGLAWRDRGEHDRAPPELQQELEAAENEAWQEMRGLWSDVSPEPPWAFRRRMRLGR